MKLAELQSPQKVACSVEVKAKLFRGLGDPTRLKILEMLREGDKCVGELVSLLGLPQGRVSSHLACLRWCGYVSTRRRGKKIYYQLVDPRVRDILELAEGLMADNAEKVLACRIIH